MALPTTIPVLEATAARAWAQSRYTTPELVYGATVAEFHAEPEHVQRFHRQRVAPLVVAMLDALAPTLAGSPGMPGDYYMGQDANAEHVRDLADEVREGIES